MESADSGAKEVTRFASLALVMALFVGLAVSVAYTKAPWDDESWFATPGWNLVTHGHMGTSALDPSTSPWKAIRVTGIDRHTYWVMPLHFLVTAAWYKLFGFSLVSLRALTIAWALAALLCWFAIVFEVSEQWNAALFTVVLLACDSSFIAGAASGRMDPMAFALASASMAVYLRLRARHFAWAITVGSALATGAFFSHPIGGVLAFLGTAMLVLEFDRDLLRVRHVGLAALPAGFGLACWAAYIAQAPADFKVQFGSNANGRWDGLCHPLLALEFEIRQRYLEHFGFASWARPEARVFGLIPAAYAVSLASALGIRGFRTRRGYGLLALLTLVFFAYFTLMEGFKAESYLFYSASMFTIVMALLIHWSWNTRSVPRLVTAGIVLVLVGLQLVRVQRLIVADTYHRVYLPVAKVLEKLAPPGTTVFGPAELGFRLGFKSTLIDDFWLGCRSGKKAQVLVIKEERVAPMESYAVTAPDVYACQTRMLKVEYQAVYQNRGYKVYIRRP